LKSSYEIIKEAIEKVGIKAVAPKMNLSKSLLYKWCQDSKEPSPYKAASGASNPLDRIKKLYEETQDPEIINWLCQAADGYFVKNSPTEKINTDARMFNNVQKFIKEFSETLDTISNSYYDDHSINAEEAEKIRKEWEDMKRIGEGFVKACEAGKFNKGKKKKSSLF